MCSSLQASTTGDQTDSSHLTQSSILGACAHPRWDTDKSRDTRVLQCYNNTAIPQQQRENREKQATRGLSPSRDDGGLLEKELGVMNYVHATVAVVALERHLKRQANQSAASGWGILSPYRTVNTHIDLIFP